MIGLFFNLLEIFIEHRFSVKFSVTEGKKQKESQTVEIGSVIQ